MIIQTQILLILSSSGKMFYCIFFTVLEKIAAGFIHEDVMLLTQEGWASFFLKSTYVGCSSPRVCRVNCCSQLIIFFLMLLAGFHLLVVTEKCGDFNVTGELETTVGQGEVPLPFG